MRATIIINHFLCIARAVEFVLIALNTQQYVKENADDDDDDRVLKFHSVALLTTRSISAISRAFAG